MNLPKSVSLSDGTSKNWQFDELQGLIEFVKDERDFWADKAHKQSEKGYSIHSFMNIHADLQTILSELITWKENFESWDEGTLTGQINGLQSGRLTPRFFQRWIWSGHPFIKTWLDAYKYSQATAEGFIEFTVNKTTNNCTNHDYFIGYALAYEFQLQDESYINKRRHSERAAFNTLRDQLATAKTKLISDVDDYQKTINDWRDETQNGVEGWLNQQIQLYSDTAKVHSEKFHERIGAWTDNVLKLEALYKEKLRLDGPARYWANSASKFRRQGFYWVFLLVITSVVAISSFGLFFSYWLLGERIAFSFKSLEGAILFAAVLSALAFLIKTFAKLTFSSFHLQRDAEEREQLTHLYLALANESVVDQDSKKIVLQALFSRSETGLLTNESGPTMPGIQDAISLAGRGGR
jgi:hypothetical protein